MAAVARLALGCSSWLLLGHAAAFSACIDKCVKTPTENGHFECCTNPLVSAFNKPSCATGCHMAEVRPLPLAASLPSLTPLTRAAPDARAQYSQSLGECESWCEKASEAGHPCAFQIPAVTGTDGAVNMCGSCDCGLHDCPGHAPPEPAQCKDPASTDPPGPGDCGWTNRCRGSLVGCKLGCKIQQAEARTSWGFVIVIVLSGAAYVGGGVGFAVKKQGKPPALDSHPHHRRWLEFGGLVADGLQLTRSKATGQAVPSASRGGGTDTVHAKT